jgi:hypothetical protein
MAFIGNTNTTQGFIPAIDYFSGNGSSVAFTLSRPVASVYQFIVAIDNVIQNPSSAYSVSGTTLTFTSAPLAGTNNIWVEYTSPITQTIAPGQGTVTTSSLASSTGSGAVVLQTSPTITTPTISSLTSAAATNLTLQSAGTTALTIDTSQNVGIGTTSPNALLHLGTGNANIRVGITASSQYLDIYRDNATGYSVYNAAQASPFRAHIWQLGGTEAMRIDTSGNVLVGTATFPTSTVSSNGVGIFSAGGVAGRINYGKTYSGTENSMANYHSGTYVGGVTYSNTATAFPTSSDLRLKKDIVDAPESLDKINSIRIVSHGWKHDDDVVKYGVIAQELYLIASQAVLKGDDGEEVIDTWSVDYSKLVPMLVKAIQEQQTIINDLKARIETLEGGK